MGTRGGSGYGGAARTVRLLRRRIDHAASEELSGRFSASRTDEILSGTWRAFGQIVPELPAEPGSGARLMMAFAALAEALYGELLAAGVSESDALTIVSETSWRVHRVALKTLKRLSRFKSADPVGKSQWVAGVLLHYPFSPPAWQMEEIVYNGDLPGFYMLRCPLADYFRSIGLSQLCHAAFCDMDFRHAKLWGATLERSDTLAAGASKCDFRWCRSESVSPNRAQ